MPAKRKDENRQITFEVITRVPLPVGEQVFISGNQHVLGNWNSEGFPLARTDDNTWAGSVILPVTEIVEYKVTRGSWESEEVQEDGRIPPNFVLEAGRSRVVRHEVKRWRDSNPGTTPQITGNYKVHEGFHSKFLRFDRTVIVWLPPSYEFAKSRRYPVLYLQDGQQVFDPQTSTWKQDWEVDEWCTRLIAEDRLKETILVAVYSTDDRFVEYNPSMAGPEYARFVVDELKPFIDREYRTRPERDSTAVAGASMGATVSFYLAWTHPDVFFGAACLSPAFRFNQDEFLFDLVKENAKAPDIRLFLYCGGGDSTEKELAETMAKMLRLLKARGLKAGKSLLVEEDASACHNETAWAKHTGAWLRFLFGK